MKQADGKLVFVTAEDESVVRAKVAENGLGGIWTIVDPLVWEEWGVANAKRGELPYPGTIVVDPTGRVVSMDLFTNHINRRAPRETIADIDREVVRDQAQAEAAGGDTVDFSTAVSLRFTRTEKGGLLYMDVAENFHIYGSKERQAVPISLAINDDTGRAKLPPGRKTNAASGTSWVLENSFTVPIFVRGDPPEVTGTLTYQACFESLCAPPSTVDWMLVR